LAFGHCALKATLWRRVMRSYGDGGGPRGLGIGGGGFGQFAAQAIQVLVNGGLEQGGGGQRSWTLHAIPSRVIRRRLLGRPSIMTSR